MHVAKFGRQTLKKKCSFLTHGYSVGVFVSHRHHCISISAFFCVLIASSLLCAPGGNRLDQSRTSLVDFSREPVRPVYTSDLSFTLLWIYSLAFAEKQFIPVTFLSYTCNYYNRLYLTVTLQRLSCIAVTIPSLTSISADNIPFLDILKTKFTTVSNIAFLSYSIVLNSVFYNIS